MSAPRFLPLVCPECAGDLDGRASDIVAFCRSCASAWRCDGQQLDRMLVAAVMESPPGSAELIHLPFWLQGDCSVPAFDTQRPMTMARIATKLLDEWPAEKTVPDPPPFGARISPASLAQTAKLANLPTPPRSAPLALLAVPARISGERLLLPVYRGQLYPGDVIEAHALRARATRSTRKS